MLLFISTIHKQPHLQISSSSPILCLLHWYSWKYKQPHQKTNYKWYEFLLISLKLYIYVCILQWDFSNEFRFDWIWSVSSCANWSTFIKFDMEVLFLLSLSSHVGQVGCRLIIKKEKASDWLTTLLKSQFFGPCMDHLELKKNEKNVFCMDCNIGFCRNCEDNHSRHRRLQICKYVYQDVVRFQDIQKHLDCSKIQVSLLIIHSFSY